METAHPVGTFIASALVWGFLLLVLLAVLRSAFLFGTLAVLPMVGSKTPDSEGTTDSEGAPGDIVSDGTPPATPPSRHRTT